MYKVFFFIITLTVALTACGTSTTPDEQTPAPEETAAAPAGQEQPAAPDYPIGDRSFRGIRVGQPIGEIVDSVEKGILQNGEGEFEIYRISTEDGRELGYFHPDPQNGSLVGDIVITSDLPMTENGLKVGMTYTELTSLIRDFAVHGSEIESRTSVYYQNLALGLDYPSANYNLDRNEIPGSAKVNEITILRAN
ncbi:hypothetical protein [Flavilitoribacter nigricans]|uniref:Uncharacterized protein n=1 Tax=Flavilitoribacter nigricans (strain ATCC 23147 / DSM 23189 / NBRC 102662 / NCIMB 1420 / SS-2) TaxID=1122177 RepID=A0A2D0NIG6_FLAN2|nr:hypothetical protein [Flavilitoribacter nigricans]PHN08295.1 hypothetical protein CRP01_02945 [Flavilitoribacter nigricans DSM 23189 = NBRC 102662]